MRAFKFDITSRRNLAYKHIDCVSSKCIVGFLLNFAIKWYSVMKYINVYIYLNT